MPFTLGTKKVVPPPAKIKQQKTKEAKERKAYISKRRQESEAILFGSELFEPLYKKEKEVVIHFPETCTNEGIYISKCGTYGYRHSQSEFYFELYYFKIPILEYENDLTIIPSDDIWLFDNLTPDELEDLACKLKRIEFAREKEEEKIKLLEEIKEAERLRQEELDRADEEFLANEANEEKEAEQLGLLDKSILQDTIEIQQNINKIESAIIDHVEKTLEELPAIKEAKIKQATKIIPFGRMNK